MVPREPCGIVIYKGEVETKKKTMTLRRDNLRLAKSVGAAQLNPTAKWLLKVMEIQALAGGEIEETGDVDTRVLSPQ